MYIVKKATKQEIAYMLKGLKGKAWEESDEGENVWENLYDKVFSEEISRQIFEEFPDFHYYDPDTTYQEDVCAFIDAFCEYAGVDPW